MYLSKAEHSWLWYHYAVSYAKVAKQRSCLGKVRALTTPVLGFAPIPGFAPTPWAFPLQIRAGCGVKIPTGDPVGVWGDH